MKLQKELAGFLKMVNSSLLLLKNLKKTKKSSILTIGYVSYEFIILNN